MSEERLYKHPSNEAQSSVKLRFSIDAKDKNKDKKDQSGFGSGLGFGKESKEFETSTPNTSRKVKILLNKKLKNVEEIRNEKSESITKGEQKPVCLQNGEQKRFVPQMASKSRLVPKFVVRKSHAPRLLENLFISGSKTRYMNCGEGEMYVMQTSF